MNQTQGRPATALPSGPVPSARAVWVTTVLAVVLALLLAVVLPRVLTVPSGGVDCSIGSATYDDEQCSDEPPPRDDLIDTEANS